jgi:hypothetical protein
VPVDGGALNVGKLFKCVTGCHNRMANLRPERPSFDEDTCEAACLAKYDQVRDNIVPFCPPCFRSPSRTSSRRTRRPALDQDLGDYYCASPSGAFVDAMP